MNNEVSMPPSPWKKPKIVSIGRTKSLKRKSEIFKSSKTDGINPNLPKVSHNTIAEDIEHSSKERKTVQSRFSISSRSFTSTKGFNFNNDIKTNTEVSILSFS